MPGVPNEFHLAFARGIVKQFACPELLRTLAQKWIFILIADHINELLLSQIGDYSDAHMIDVSLSFVSVSFT